MKQLSYLKLNKAETRDLLRELNPHIDGSDISEDSADILSAALPFYPGYRLLEITDRSNNPVRKRFLIYRSDDLVVIDYTNGPVYALNSRCPIAISQDNVVSYVQFFFSFVRGKHGAFQTVESVDEIRWRDDPTPNARRSLSEMINPMSIKTIEEDGTYIIATNIIFKNALFQCEVTAKQNGIVRLSNEKLLVQDLPLLDDVMVA